MTPEAFSAAVDLELQAVRALLVAKNAAYGNAALEPRPVFSALCPAARLEARLDEKLARVATFTAAGLVAREDDVADLLGCLVLLRIARRQGEPR